jgi:chromosome segregation ATPase
MRLTAAERRSVVESILDIGVFSSMNTHLKERISNNKEELQHSETALAIKKERVNVLVRMSEEEKRRNEVDSEWEAEQVAAANKTILDAKTDIKNSLAAVQSHMDTVTDSNSIKENFEKYTNIKSQIQKKMTTLRKEIGFYETNDHCPTCTQKIDEQFKTSAIARGNAKSTDMEKAIEDIANEILTSQERIEEIGKVMVLVQQHNTNIVKKTNEIESTEKHIKTLTTKKTVKTVDVEKELSDAMSLQEEAAEEKRDLIEEQHYLSLAGTLLKDSGIKSRIIKNYIPIINDTINKYLTQMNFFVNFNLDEEFNETIKSRHRDIFTYASFSEGEKKKIDLALLFAWRAIASTKNSITTNLLILDEILDGSLDDQATDAFLDIMASTKTGTNTFVISHKPKEVLQDKFDRCIQFVKRGNFSRIS